MVDLKSDFYKILSHKIELDVDDDELILTYGENNKINILKLNDLQNERNIRDVPKIVYSDDLFSFNPYGYDYILYPFMTTKTIDQIRIYENNIPLINRFTYVRKFTNGQYLRASVICKLEKTNDIYCIVY